MGNININGVILKPTKIIFNSKGDIYHGIKISDEGFNGFGEAYFSSIIGGEIKAWKRHHKMTLNLVVPTGIVKFVLYDGRLESETYQNIMEIILSIDNYLRLTIPPGIWVGFKGLSSNLNLILNVANIEHDPTEQENILDENLSIGYDWN
jgi:dTDP-4-dehydrorhamnose 3,5-epimerase